MCAKEELNYIRHGTTLSYKDFDVRLNHMRVILMFPCMLHMDKIEDKAEVSDSAAFAGLVFAVEAVLGFNLLNYSPGLGFRLQTLPHAIKKSVPQPENALLSSDVL